MTNETTKKSCHETIAMLLDTSSMDSSRTKQSLAQLDDDLLKRHRRCTELATYVDALADTGELLAEFDARLWAANVDVVTVQGDGTMVFRFKDGHSIDFR